MFLPYYNIFSLRNVQYNQVPVPHIQQILSPRTRTNSKENQVNTAEENAPESR